jgi:hypothetical protein
LLLQDKTTGRNIIWATDTYAYLGPYFSAESQIESKLVVGINQNMIQPRICKTLETQAARTKKHAEVFTPAWVCCLMNNNLDAEWFGRVDVFNRLDGQTWIPTQAPIEFPVGITWQQYVDSRRLEITCGEAPFLASRYDAADGKLIPIAQRIGLLDRKLRVVNENAADAAAWMKWTLRAFQSVYGYEYQGDNLLIARINLLMTFADYLEDRWHRLPTEKELRKVANILAWNLWQMDGLKGTVPLGMPEENCEQLSLFESAQKADEHTNCRIMDWRAERSVQYLDLQEGRG